MNLLQTSKLVLKLISAYIKDEKPAVDLTPQQVNEVFALANSHDISHLLGIALNKYDIPNKEKYEPFFQAQYKAVFRYRKLEFERQRIYEQLEKNGIPFIPLKGCVTCEFYPENWHRTSCDIDILIKPENLEIATMLLSDKLGFEKKGSSEHDISLFSPNNIHLELHYDFHENHISNEEIWKTVFLVENKKYHYLMPNEVFFFCQYAHMAKHFKWGGCGLRPFIDIIMFERNMPYNADKLNAILEENGLKVFAEQMHKLIELWFYGGKADRALDLISEYILSAGAYGSAENRIAVKRTEGKSRFEYTMLRIFPPLSNLKYGYPILEKKPWLLPVCYVRRWIKLIRKGKLKTAKSEFLINSNLDENRKNDIADILDNLQI